MAGDGQRLSIAWGRRDVARATIWYICLGVTDTKLVLLDHFCKLVWVSWKDTKDSGTLSGI